MPSCVIDSRFPRPTVVCVRESPSVFLSACLCVCWGGVIVAGLIVEVCVCVYVAPQVICEADNVEVSVGGFPSSGASCL